MDDFFDLQNHQPGFPPVPEQIAQRRAPFAPIDQRGNPESGNMMMSQRQLFQDQLGHLSPPHQPGPQAPAIVDVAIVQ